MPKENNTSSINLLSIQMAKIGEQVKNIEENVARVDGGVVDIKKKLEAEFATKEWCENKFGQTTRTVNGILVAFGLAIVSAIAGFIIKGGLK